MPPTECKWASAPERCKWLHAHEGAQARPREDAPASNYYHYLTPTRVPRKKNRSSMALCSGPA
eukprot:scaffold54964_cov30-Tisochrysis_lutea.AAC.8